MDPKLTAALTDYILHLRKHAEKYYAKHLPRLEVPDIHVQKGGRKYLRVVQEGKCDQKIRWNCQDVQ